MSCHHICVKTKAGPKCLCSDGFELNSDGITCTGNVLIFFYILTQCLEAT